MASSPSPLPGGATLPRPHQTVAGDFLNRKIEDLRDAISRGDVEKARAVASALAQNRVGLQLKLVPTPTPQKESENIR